MSALCLNEEQTKLLRLCLKHAEPLKPNWEKVRDEGNMVSTSAASQRWGRLYKLLIGDEKASAPGKGKGGTGKAGAATPKQKTQVNKKATIGKASETLDKDPNEPVDGRSTIRSISQTPKKRTHEVQLERDGESETPTKAIKTELKTEDKDIVSEFLRD